MIDDEDQSDSAQPSTASRRRIQFNIAPKGLTGINETSKCRSASKKFIDILKKLKCTCGEIFSRTNIPVIANCGHYVCASHKNDANPFQCKKPCRMKTDRNSFLIDKVLEDFYKTVRNEGFRCQECEKYHPLQNSVQCYTSIKEPESPFMCVWCAIKDNNYEEYDLRSIQNEGLRQENMDLISLDRTEDSAGWALNVCAICADSLHMPSDSGQSNIVHLQCDHIGHGKCPSSRYHNGRKRRKVKCKLCGQDSTDQQIKTRTSHAKENLKTLGEDQYYHPCGKCHQHHPQSNIARYISNYGDANKCVWCHLETKEDEPLEKEKKVNEKRSNANGSNQINSTDKGKCGIV